MGSTPMEQVTAQTKAPRKLRSRVLKGNYLTFGLICLALVHPSMVISLLLLSIS